MKTIIDDLVDVSDRVIGSSSSPTNMAEARALKRRVVKEQLLYLATERPDLASVSLSEVATVLIATDRLLRNA